MVLLKKQMIINAHRDWKATVNMNFSDILRFSRSSCGKRVTGRFFRQARKLFGTPLKRWTSEHARLARRHIRFIRANKGLKRGSPIGGGCRLSRRTLSLMAHGFDPNK